MEGFKELMQQAHGGDKGARDTLIAGNLGLVHTIANRFEHRGHEREELFQIGCILLLPLILGLNGIWMGVVVAEMLTLIVTVYFLRSRRKVYHY